MLRNRRLAVLAVTLATTAHADWLVVEVTHPDATLEPVIAIFIPGIEDMDPHDIAREAAILALSPEGWDLSTTGAMLFSFGPPDAPEWEGGTEWSVHGVPGKLSESFGYPLNAEALAHSGRRHLMFHTDDHVFRGGHDVCEPLPFGIVSGFMDGSAFQCPVGNWGIFYTDSCFGVDTDEDGVVGIGDFLLVLAQWGPCPPQCLGDVDGDNIVGINDLLLVLANWGPCR